MIGGRTATAPGAGATRAGHRLLLALAVLVVVLVELLPGPSATADPTRPTGGADSSTGISGLSTPSSTGQAGTSSSTVPIAASSASSDPSSPLSVTITEVTQPAVGGTTVSVSGTLATSSTEPISDLWMSVSLGTAVRSRGQLASLAEDAREAARHGGGSYEQLALPNGQRAQPLADPPVRGASPVPFQITGDLGGAPAMSIGVYPLRIKVSGTVGTTPVTAAAYSFVVRSRATAVRTPVAVVLPIADRPRLRSDGLLTDNQLATDVGPGGRLTRLLAAASPPVTLAVDPTLVQELFRMSDPGGYRFASPGAAAGVPARASNDAFTFLKGLAYYAAHGGSVIALPYGDVDLTALVHAQKLDIVHYALNTGQTVVAERLSREPQQAGTVIYPVDGLADAPTVDVLRQLNAGTVLLDDREFPTVARRNFTPAAAVTLTTSAGPVRALRTDHTLTELADAYTASTADPTAGAQLARFTAELAMITAENPTPRPQVLALPRDWNAPGTWAEQILGAVNGTATTTTTLDDPAFVPTAQAVLPVSQLAYSADARGAELPANYLDSVSSVRAEAQALGPVLCAPPRATSTCVQKKVDPMSNALVTATSVWWRGAGRVDGVSLSQQVDGHVSAIRNGIRVVASRSVNLTSRHGLVPLTLENTTGYEVTVVLMFSSTNRARLRSPVRQVRVLPSGQKAQIEFAVDAEGAGTFLLEIDRRNLDGQRLSADPPTRVLVRSTVYGAIATGITIVALSLLGLAVLLRLARRLRPRRRGSQDDRHDSAPTDEWTLGYPPPEGYDPSHGYSTTQVDGPRPGHGPLGGQPVGPAESPSGGPAQPTGGGAPRRELRPAHHGGPNQVTGAEQSYDLSAAPPPRHHRRSEP